jgi:hypothetical protein
MEMGFSVVCCVRGDESSMCAVLVDEIMTVGEFKLRVNAQVDFLLVYFIHEPFHHTNL